MAEKINLTENEKNIIFAKYNNGISLREIAKASKYSFAFIQKLINSDGFDKIIEGNYLPKEGYNIIAICKKTGKILYDYKNSSGAILDHINKTYPKEIIPSTRYLRKSIEHKTGKFWYDEYFTFDYEKIKNVKKCVYCDWTTEDINNKSGAYEKHLETIHGINLKEHTINHPEENSYIRKRIYQDEELVSCKICGKKFKQINFKHLNEHNITPYEYKLQYGSDGCISPEVKEGMIIRYNKTLKHCGFKKTSKPEQLINDSLNINFESSNRAILNGLEIDLVNHEHKIGIEFNGNLHHSENFGKKDRNYHLNKTKKANENGYKLIHIFEDEFAYKFDIVINKLKHIFKISIDNKIHARKCIIKDNINPDIKSKFLEKNHIQGNDNSNIILGAYYNNELVALMTFDNKRSLNKEANHNENNYELTRFCIKNCYQITGIAAKILSHFIKTYNPERIISFADRRWTLDKDNNLYVKLGFKLIEVLDPDYTYYCPKVDRYRRFHKFGFGKSNIKKRFPYVYSFNKTEWEMMQELGYDRIWDCGKFKYEMIINK
jgi:very-short-patch-repair endonuclease